VGALLARSSSSSEPIGGPAATWAAGTRRAPDFRLSDQSGGPVSLASLRGRPVVLTFIDPLCRNLCPLEARVLGQAVAKLPAAQRPAIVAVSVNQWGNARSNLLLDVQKWQLPSGWRWAVGAAPQLRRVWRNYQISVLDAPKTIAGVTVHNIVHTEASYLIDAAGYQRALYLWPFHANDVERSLRALGR
jgi:cytochrome oxidase Cu insertion factor (SCO1/SenC/PrrC family)